MATQLQIRRGTSSQVSAFTGAVGELVVNTTNDSVHVNDGSTAGGFELARVDGSNWAITNNVGIGTSAPSHKLEIESSSDADLLQVQSTAGSNDTALRLGISGDVATINATGGSTGILALKTYGTERLRVDASGNVGIGTSSPDTQLTLYKASTNADVDYAKMRMDSWGGSTGKLKALYGMTRVTM